MYFIDTHTHLFAEEFNADRNIIIREAINKGITKFILPNVDSNTISTMLDVCNQWPLNCFPAIGLHPTSVTQKLNEELAVIEESLQKNNYIAIGEIGIDLYWDKSMLKEQIIAFKTQINWAKEKNLPVIIHSRNSYDEIFEVIEQENADTLKGVFHCFCGTEKQAGFITDRGFYVGIGGVVTYKNSGLDKVVQQIPLDKILLETDSPYLPPVPKRGMRNESGFITYIAQKIADIKECSINEVAAITTSNAKNLFKIQ